MQGGKQLEWTVDSADAPQWQTHDLSDFKHRKITTFGPTIHAIGFPDSSTRVLLFCEDQVVHGAPLADTVARTT